MALVAPIAGIKSDLFTPISAPISVALMSEVSAVSSISTKCLRYNQNNVPCSTVPSLKTYWLANVDSVFASIGWGGMYAKNLTTGADSTVWIPGHGWANGASVESSYASDDGGGGGGFDSGIDFVQYPKSTSYSPKEVNGVWFLFNTPPGAQAQIWESCTSAEPTVLSDNGGPSSQPLDILRGNIVSVAPAADINGAGPADYSVFKLPPPDYTGLWTAGGAWTYFATRWYLLFNGVSYGLNGFSPNRPDGNAGGGAGGTGSAGNTDGAANAGGGGGGQL